MIEMNEFTDCIRDVVVVVVVFVVKVVEVGNCDEDVVEDTVVTVEIPFGGVDNEPVVAVGETGIEVVERVEVADLLGQPTSPIFGPCASSISRKWRIIMNIIINSYSYLVEFQFSKQFRNHN